YYAGCTAAIRKYGDPTTVFDFEFRVRGITGLRVVDVSAFPKTPGFFSTLPLYIMSERAADVINQDVSH
ncbi:hypothetical protein BDZ45DRAFT_605137, partial [Acephala macrosclerotiorum]